MDQRGTKGGRYQGNQRRGRPRRYRGIRIWAPGVRDGVAPDDRGEDDSQGVVETKVRFPLLREVWWEEWKVNRLFKPWLL